MIARRKCNADYGGAGNGGLYSCSYRIAGKIIVDTFILYLSLTYLQPCLKRKLPVLCLPRTGHVQENSILIEDFMDKVPTPGSGSELCIEQETERVLIKGRPGVRLKSGNPGL